MTNIIDLIPKDKGDIETAQKLSNYSYEELKPIIPQLMSCIEDMNWPIGRYVANYLKTITEHLSGEILEVLKTNDGMWKYWTLIVFEDTITDEAVLNEIKRIASNPTYDEIDCEVNELAKEIIAKRNSSPTKTGAGL